MRYFLLTLLFVSLSALLFFGFLLAQLFYPSIERVGTVEITVEPGEPFSSVVRKLKDKEVIPNKKLFSFWARLWSVDKKIHSGVYRFELPLSPRKILNRMMLGKIILRRITVPEGLTIKEIGELLEIENMAREDQVLAEARDPEFLSLLGLQGKGLEGYLFPDTYHFAPYIKERDILIKMSEQFRRIFNPEMKERAKEIRLSLHEVITLASLIEKETAKESERPLVSAVFHNRLKYKMPLQSDPTVIYGLEDFSGNLTRQDLQSPSPYNTYRIKGLPPAPICNPGLASILAALYPAPARYLYFVSKNDGSHVFSVSLKEHNRAVRIYQKQRRRVRSQ